MTYDHDTESTRSGKSELWCWYVGKAVHDHCWAAQSQASCSGSLSWDTLYCLDNDQPCCKHSSTHH